MMDMEADWQGRLGRHLTWKTLGAAALAGAAAVATWKAVHDARERRISLELTRTDVAVLDKLVELGFAHSRDDAVRKALRALSLTRRQNPSTGAHVATNQAPPHAPPHAASGPASAAAPAPAAVPPVATRVANRLIVPLRLREPVDGTLSGA